MSSWSWLVAVLSVGGLKPSSGLRTRHVVRQQHFHGEADSFSLEDAVSVIESQNICGKTSEASIRTITICAWWLWGLTYTLLAGGRSAIHPRAPGERCISGWVRLPSSGWLSSIPPFSPSETPRNQCRRSLWRTATCTGEDHISFRSTLLKSALLPPERPENTAREEDLVVQLLSGPTFDHGALLVVHTDVVPHVVRGGNRPDVVYLQPHQAEKRS